MDITGTQEGVIILNKDGEPAVIVRKNGTLEFFRVTKMAFGDFVEFFEADVPGVESSA